MKNNFGIKLVAVLDVNILRMFEAEGIKVTKKLHSHKIHSDINHAESKHDGYNQKKSTPSSFFDPHTQTKDIECQESSNAASGLIEALLSNHSEYKELILVADAKMLGYLRNKLSANVSKLISREIDKDLVKHDMKDIEKAIFGSN